MKNFAFFFLAVISTAALRAQSIQWNFGTTTPTASPTNLRLSYGNISPIVDGQTNGATTIEAQQVNTTGDYLGASGAFNLRLCTKVGNFNMNQSSYISFSITPSSNQKVPDLTGFQVGMRAGGGSRPTDWVLLSSVNNFVNHTVLARGTTGDNNQWNLQNASFFLSPNFGETVSFRLYFYGNSGNQPANNTPTLRLDDLQFLNAEALNVSLTQFSAVADQSAARLAWTTAEEKNNAFFEIEHSTDGAQFSTVGMVKGAGNAATASTYQYKHLQTAQGMNYYRLRAIDFAGNATTSVVKSVQIERETGFKAYPTLTTTILNLETRDETPDLRYDIVSLNGQTVKSGVFTLQTSVEVDDLQPGAYLVRVNQSIKKFVKQ